MSKSSEDIEKFAEQLMEMPEFKPLIEQMQTELDQLSAQEVREMEERLRRFYGDLVQWYDDPD
jgi:hypothetical protein